MDIEEFTMLLEQDDKSICREIMKRPGMYVGVPRLDYIQHFLGGLSMARTVLTNGKLQQEWNQNYEFQYWLLLNQSVSLRTLSVNGWTLFYRCFGTYSVALGQFVKYLHSTIPAPPVKEHNYQVSAAYDICSMVEKLKNGSNNTLQNCREKIINLIRLLVESKNKKYDLIRIYIRKEGLFSQIRFIYHTENGWLDDTDIISHQNNYGNLVALHAYLECVDDRDLYRLGDHIEGLCFMINHENSFESGDVSDIGHELKDEKSFMYLYQQWRDTFTTTY